MLLGFYDREPRINQEEVSDWKWMKPGDIKADLEVNSGAYTAWFRIIFDRFYEHFKEIEIDYEG